MFPSLLSLLRENIASSSKEVEVYSTVNSKHQCDGKKNLMCLSF